MEEARPGAAIGIDYHSISTQWIMLWYFLIWMTAAEDAPPDKNSCPRVMQADIDAADFQALND
jgi:hypothetical protein